MDTIASSALLSLCSTVSSFSTTAGDESGWQPESIPIIRPKSGATKQEKSLGGMDSSRDSSRRMRATWNVIETRFSAFVIAWCILRTFRCTLRRIVCSWLSDHRFTRPATTNEAGNDGEHGRREQQGLDGFHFQEVSKG